MTTQVLMTISHWGRFSGDERFLPLSLPIRRQGSGEPLALRFLAPSCVAPRPLLFFGIWLLGF